VGGGEVEGAQRAEGGGGAMRDGDAPTAAGLAPPPSLFTA
jgi:hypothetical protein